MDKVNIGVVGSMGDLDLTEKARVIAAELGKEIAARKMRLLFGFEGDFDSLSEIAAKSAEKHNGETVAYLWGEKEVPLKGLRSKVIVTGMPRGGAREFVFISNCDAIICIGGGSGTLTEVAMAYQRGIPIVVIEGTGGWSDKLKGQYLDSRERVLIQAAKLPSDAVSLALKSIQEKQ